MKNLAASFVGQSKNLKSIISRNARLLLIIPCSTIVGILFGFVPAIIALAYLHFTVRAVIMRFL